MVNLLQLVNTSTATYMIHNQVDGVKGFLKAQTQLANQILSSFRPIKYVGLMTGIFPEG